MPFGYSNNFVTAVRERARSSPNDPVVRLCYLCIENDMMLSDAAVKIGVSKQTIYNWFNGAYRPKPQTERKIVKLNERLHERLEKRKKKQKA
jgi:DNA-binding XRE family transcriptional regulator